MSTCRTEPAGAALRRWLPFLGVLLTGVALLFLLDGTQIDRQLANRFYDPVSRTFPLRHNELLEVVLHHWAKYLVILLGSLTIATFLLSFMISSLRSQRRLLLFVALSLTLAPATVTALKAVSNKHCPWDVAEYGGMVPYMRLFERSPTTQRGGHCFPAGHASTGFALMSLYFVGRARRRPAMALAGLATGILAGGALGLGRMMQGAHFLSHTLWSGLVCWLVIGLLASAMLRLPATERLSESPPTGPTNCH